MGLGEWGEYRPSALSGGMQQRVGLARALASNPEILLMDEPFSALAPLIRRDMQNELMRLQGQMQKTTIFITHDLSEAVRLGNRIAIMRDGAVIQMGTPEEIVADPADEYVADFTRDVRPSTVLTVGYFIDRQGTKRASAEASRPNARVSFEQPNSANDHSGGDAGEASLSSMAVPSQTKTSDQQEEKIRDSSLSGRMNVAFGRMSHITVLLLGLLSLAASTAIVAAFWGVGVSFPANWGPEIANVVNDFLRWLTRTGAPVFDTVADAVLTFLLLLEDALRWLPWPTVVLGIALLSWRTVGWRLGAFAVGSLTAVGLVGLWESAMETMALIVVAVILSVAIAIPLGIVAARNNSVESTIRPILDGMQTMPAFVYLVPGIMLFGIGNVPGIFATVIYAVPPAIRLTNLGIRQVTPQVVEAAQSFGTTRRQLLLKVQSPMAMVVVASLVGAGGLGEDVLRGLGRFRPGEALLAGLAVVALAIILDRITQAWARERQSALRSKKE